MDMDRYSDESESSDPQAFLEDRELTRQRSRTPPSSQTPPLSPEGHSERRRRRHHDSRSHSDVLKMLMDEEQVQSRSTRKFLRSALQRLDNETLRAQKAESQALEIAQRFKIISDGHRQLQADLSRAHEELRLYKVQYDNAQREIHRGQEILKSLEQQRDEAEERAAKDRTTARRLKEEQLTNRAREEGRKAGYAEGLRRGLEQARFERLRDNLDSERTEDDAGMGPEPDSLTDSRADPLDDLGVRNFSSPSGHAINIESPVPQHIIPPLSAPSAPPGEQGSRFREHGIGATPGPRPSSLASGSQGWNELPIRPVSVHNASPSPHHPDTRVPPDGWIPPSDDGVIRIPPPHELQRPPSPHSPSEPLPIPLRPPSSTRTNPTPPNARDYAYVKRSSQESIPLSIPSTTISQFDIVSTPGQSAPSVSGRERRSALSVIQEVSSSMEYSPGMDSRGMPEPLTFPVSPAERAAAAEEFPNPHRRSRNASQRLADELRFDDPNVVEEWRQNAELRSASSNQSLPRHRPANLTTPAPLSPGRSREVREVRPSSAASGASGVPYRPRSVLSHTSDVNSSIGGRRPVSSSQEWVIDVVPPSGPPSSTFSPVAAPTMGMLSPNGMLAPLPPPAQPVQPPPREVPTAPNSPSTMGRYPSMGMLPDTIQTVSNLPPGFFPSGPATPIAHNAQLAPPAPPRSTTPSIYGPPPAQVQRVQRSSSSTSSLAPNDLPKPMHTRSRSAGQSFSSAGDELRSRTPGIRPPSAASSSASRPAYAVAPTPSNIQYPAPPGGPTGPTSPRSVVSQLSSHQRSLSLNAGSTPAPSSRPLSTAPPPKLRRVPSDASTNSVMSGVSRHSAYNRYNPDEYVDAAFLASSEDLTANVFSPHTSANTRANASNYRRTSNLSGSHNSPAQSYANLHR